MSQRSSLPIELKLKRPPPDPLPAREIKRRIRTTPSIKLQRRTDGRKWGAGKTDFDKSVVEGLCHIWCTIEEIEFILRTDRKCLNIWAKRMYGKPFSDVYNHFAAGGNASLRRNQMRLSQDNAAMGIWLGKQRLGQREDPIDSQSFNGELKEYISFLKNKHRNRRARASAEQMKKYDATKSLIEGE